jgi:hypothetical protein
MAGGALGTGGRCGTGDAVDGSRDLACAAGETDGKREREGQARWSTDLRIEITLLDQQ